MGTLGFLSGWVAANIVGFVGGSALGATSTGLIPQAWSGYVGLVAGDLVYGSSVGALQWLMLRRRVGRVMPALWIAATASGFTIGARVGSLLTHPIAGDWLPPGVVFGALMGASVGCTTAPLLLRAGWTPRGSAWVAISVLAWIGGESIAFATHFAPASVPWTGLAVAAVTGLGLVTLGSLDRDRAAVE